MTNSNPLKPMQQGSQDSFRVTYGGQTKTVTGAKDGLDAARKAFGASGDKATTVKETTKRWF